MRILEQVFCGCVRLQWAGVLVGRAGAPAEEQPKPPDRGAKLAGAWRLHRKGSMRVACHVVFGP